MQLNLFAEHYEQLNGKKPDNKLEPRDYQWDVIERGAGQMRRGRRRGIIQGETGSGKTIVAGKLTERAIKKGSRCLILADRRKLIEQFSGVMDTFGIPHGIIMAGETRSTYQPCILASRDTLLAWKKRNLELPPPFDLVQVDECHGVAAAAYEAVLSLWPKAFAIGYTATPVRADGKSLTYFEWIECIAPPSQLIAEGWLIKPEVIWPKELAQKRKLGRQIKTLGGDPVATWCTYADGLPTVAFCESVVESVALCTRFLEEGIPAEHIDSKCSDEERHGKYKRVANGTTKILCSVDLLIEGIDIPELSCAILYRKFSSFGAFRQAAGRIMRPAPWIGKTRAVVLDFSGATGEHGRPGEDFDWTSIHLSISQRRQAAIDSGKSRPLIVCTKCGFGYEATATCPSCGHAAGKQPKARKTAQQIRDELLVPFEQETPGEYDARVQESHRRIWMRCIYIAINKPNAKVIAAMAMFKRATGKWPDEAGIKDAPARNLRGLPAKDVFSQYVKVKTL